MAYYHPFITTLKAIRSGAYFSEALQNNNCDNIKQRQRNDSYAQKHLSVKLLYSGIIFLTSTIIAGRSIFNWTKSKIKKMMKNYKKNHPNKNSPQSSFVPPLTSTNNFTTNFNHNNQQPSNQQSGQSQVANPNTNIPTTNNQSPDIINASPKKIDPFSLDEALSINGELLLKKLKILKLNENNNKYGSYYIYDPNGTIKWYFNDSGLFTPDHKIIFDHHNNIIDLTNLVFQYNKSLWSDICTINNYFLN